MGSSNSLCPKHPEHASSCILFLQIQTSVCIRPRTGGRQSVYKKLTLTSYHTTNTLMKYFTSRLAKIRYLFDLLKIDGRVIFFLEPGGDFQSSSKALTSRTLDQGTGPGLFLLKKSSGPSTIGLKLVLVSQTSTRLTRTFARLAGMYVMHIDVLVTSKPSSVRPRLSLSRKTREALALSALNHWISSGYSKV